VPFAGVDTEVSAQAYTGKLAHLVHYLTTPLTLLVVFLSMMVLPAAQVLHQPSGGMAPRAAAKASTAAEKLKFVMRFNSQAANTLWAICFFWIQFSLSLRFCCSLSCSLRQWILNDHKVLRQLHQGFNSRDMIEGLHVNLSASVQTLKDVRNVVYISHFGGAIIREFACKSISSGVGEDRSKRPVDTVIR
jgi:hypothetical protein